jgi:hypothetical protein
MKEFVWIINFTGEGNLELLIVSVTCSQLPVTRDRKLGTRDRYNMVFKKMNLNTNKKEENNEFDKAITQCQ